MISHRRRHELALLTSEITLTARPDAPADLAEWVAEHATAAPDLAVRLPQVTRLLRAWSARCPQAGIAFAAVTAALYGRVDVSATLTTREAAERLQLTESGIRWLAARGRFPGSRHNRITGRWEIPAAAVTAYRGRPDAG